MQQLEQTKQGGARPTQPVRPKKKNLAIHLFAGGVAGCCEAVSCHPLDTIKVRLQLKGERRIGVNAIPVGGPGMTRVKEAFNF